MVSVVTGDHRNNAGEREDCDRHGPEQDFRARVVAHLVRDEGVAGSNPATPTSFSQHRWPTGPVMGNETSSAKVESCGPNPLYCGSGIDRINSLNQSGRPRSPSAG
jgi:hypothetical protein